MITANEDRERVISKLLGELTIVEKLSQLLHESPAVPRVDLESYNWWNECLHGVARAGRATVFPQVIGMAASFDRDLLLRVGIAIGTEARAKFHQAIAHDVRGQYRGLTFWSPNINIFRDPRWGRGQETFGEDPWLTGWLASGLVEGLQGSDPEHQRVAACAKHFVVHSGPENQRHTFNAIVNRKDLEETYFPAFRTLVETGVESVMGAYNRTNGQPCCASPTLISEKLRAEWGFDGHFVSDCWALRDIHTCHGVTRDAKETVALALKSGCDLNCGCTYSEAMEAFRSGLISECDIDRSLSRLFRTRWKLGLLPGAPPSPYAATPIEVVECTEHLELAREAAEKGCVLLKNDDVLPLREDLGKILVVGPLASSLEALMGSYHGVGSQMSSVLEGLAHRVSPLTTLEYRQGCMLEGKSPAERDWVFFEAKRSDVVVAVMGLSPLIEGEEGDAILSHACGDRVDTALPQGQIDFLRKLSALGTPIVVVLMGGSAITSPEIEQYADAVLFAWYPGQCGGEVVARLLYGDVNPSGRLPFTIPRSLQDLPPFEDYSMKGRTYRYLESVPLFPFGFGLSYTRFAYFDLEVSNEQLHFGENLHIRVKVVNVGPCSGREVAQVYRAGPMGGSDQPLFELLSAYPFELGPGESRDLAFSVPGDRLRQYNADGEFVWSAGTMRLWVGGSQPDDRSRELGLAAPLQKSVDLFPRTPLAKEIGESQNPSE